MPATLPIRQLILGSGQPKIIVPIVGRTQSEVLAAAQAAAAHPLVDLIEWRADHWDAALDTAAVCHLLPTLRDLLQDKPLLFTFRTSREGGEKDISPAAYLALCEAVAQSGQVDLIDVEMFSPLAKECVSHVHACHVPVVGSWHDFAQTPGEKDLIARFHAMQEVGADVLKIAVMPRCLEDVTHLIHAAQTVYQETLRPLCAISMGDMGRITRLHCAQFGGCMTFGSLGALSAPGQVGVQELYAALQADRQIFPL